MTKAEIMEVRDLGEKMAEKLASIIVKFAARLHAEHRTEISGMVLVAMATSEGSADKDVIAAVDGCKCPGCLRQVIEAVAGAFGVSVVEVEHAPGSGSKSAAVH